MNRRSAVLAIAIFITSSVSAPGAVKAQDRPGTDVEELAEKLVHQVAQIQSGDVVRITGSVRDVDLLEALAVNVRKLGAFPFITINSDRLDRRMYDDVPEQYDGQSPNLELALAGIVAAEFNVEYSERQGAVLAGVPARRINTSDSAQTSVSILKNSRGVQQINLGNEIYPTEAVARRFGMPLPVLETLFWTAVNVDYDELRARAEAVKSVFESGSVVHITHPNGTDLTANIAESLVFVSDGVISEEDMALAGASRLTWLPAGEVYFVPDLTSVSGKVVVDRQFFQGETVEGLTLTFEAGRLTSMTAESGLDALKEAYDQADLGKEEFAFIDVGINPAMRLPPTSDMVAWIVDGMVTVGIGANAWAGGGNNNTYSLTTHLPGTTLMVDGVVLIDGGKVVLPGEPPS